MMNNPNNKNKNDISNKNKTNKSNKIRLINLTRTRLIILQEYKIKFLGQNLLYLKEITKKDNSSCREIVCVLYFNFYTSSKRLIELKLVLNRILFCL